MLEKKIRRRMSEISENLDLDVCWVRTKLELLAAAEKGLFSLYHEIWLETDPGLSSFHTERTGFGYFNGLIISKRNGFLFTAQRKGEIVAYVASAALESRPWDLVEAGRCADYDRYVDIETTGHFRDSAVAMPLRRRGIASNMTCLLFGANEHVGIKRMLCFLDREDERGCSVAHRLGGEQIEGFVLNVERVERTEKRIFFTFDLK